MLVDLRAKKITGKDAFISVEFHAEETCVIQDRNGERIAAGARVGEELAVPVFLYGQLATRPEHRMNAHTAFLIWTRRLADGVTPPRPQYSVCSFPGLSVIAQPATIMS